MVLPVVLILCDPAVFHSRVFGVGLPWLGRVKPFCYAATAVAVSVLAVWLRRPRSSAFVSGIFFGSGLFAFSLGVAILPLSLMGILFLGLGVLGFLPFVMSVVYLRTAYVALPERQVRFRLSRCVLGVLGALGFACGTQATASHVFDESVAVISAENPAARVRGTAALRRWAVVLDLELLVPIYLGEKDPEKKARIAQIYKELTGEDAEARAVEWAD